MVEAHAHKGLITVTWGELEVTGTCFDIGDDGCAVLALSCVVDNGMLWQGVVF